MQVPLKMPIASHDIIVPTGGFEIRSSGLLKACLGSCVGLALHDRRQRRGGLLHLLLPEPICDIPETHLSYYASTGVPLAIQALQDLGSERADLKAFIAGGALVDPMTPEDISLNIGERTLEITLKILTYYDIPIQRIEASGVTPCLLSFRADTGACTVKPLLNEPRGNNASIVRPGPDELDHIIENVLPVPQEALKVSRMLASQESDISQIARAIMKDQVLSARVLRLCNSSYISPCRQITSIEQAVIHLGNSLLLQLIITAQTEQFLSHYGKGYSLSRGGLYFHALGTARLCELVARKNGRVRADIAYAAGLIHDIGKVVLDQYIDKDNPLFYRMIIEEQKDSCRIEEELLGMDHARAGLLLAERWNLPDMLREVIACHHFPQRAAAHPELVHLVYVCDVLINRFHAGYEAEHMQTAALEESLRLIAPNPEEIFALLPKVNLFD